MSAGQHAERRALTRATITMRRPPNSASAGTAASCSSATSSRSWSAAPIAGRTARWTRSRGASIRCHGGPSLSRAISSRARRARSRWSARSASRRCSISPGKRVLVRRWIDGVPLHIARPLGDRAYFRSARAALRKLHTRRLLPQRSRQGAELAARHRRARLSHRLSTFRAAQPARPVLPPRGLRGSAPSTSSTSAATCPKR